METKKLSDEQCIRALRLVLLDGETNVFVGRCQKCGYLMGVLPENDLAYCYSCMEFWNLAQVAEHVRDRKIAGKRIRQVFPSFRRSLECGPVDRETDLAVLFARLTV